MYIHLMFVSLEANITTADEIILYFRNWCVCVCVCVLGGRFLLCFLSQHARCLLPPQPL